MATCSYGSRPPVRRRWLFCRHGENGSFLSVSVSRGGPKFTGLVNHGSSRHQLRRTSFPTARGKANEPAGHKQLTVTRHDAEISDDQKRKAVEVR